MGTKIWTFLERLSKYSRIFVYNLQPSTSMFTTPPSNLLIHLSKQSLSLQRAIESRIPFHFIKITVFKKPTAVEWFLLLTTRIDRRANFLTSIAAVLCSKGIRLAPHLTYQSLCKSYSGLALTLTTDQTATHFVVKNILETFQQHHSYWFMWDWKFFETHFVKLCGKYRNRSGNKCMDLETLLNRTSCPSF